MNLITGSLAFRSSLIFRSTSSWVLILFGVELTRAVQSHAGRPAAATESQREGRAENAIRMLLRLSAAQAPPLQSSTTNRTPTPAEAGRS